MDGVIIDSEPLWRRAMIAGFNDIGIDFTEDDCRKTTGMRFKEVVEHWFEHHTITKISPDELNTKVINHLIELINAEGKEMVGTLDALNFFRDKKYQIGLATSSSHNLVDAILDKLQARSYFSVITSAEFLKYGKPHPEVFLKCAQELNVHPHECLVIEDSLNGVISAKAAQMKVIALPDPEHAGNQKFLMADHCLNNLHDVIKLF
jgi:HAD superfamily hydrolase (TIGR01509 family)